MIVEDKIMIKSGESPSIRPAVELTDVFLVLYCPLLAERKTGLVLGCSTSTPPG